MSGDQTPAVRAPLARIQQAILLIRGQKVMLDSDLAALYGVKTNALNQAVNRHAKRFPADFMFQFTRREFASLKSQTGTSSWGGRRTPPHAFTEQGVAMLSSVLNSERAIAANIAIMCAFVHLREMLASHADLQQRLDELEKKYDAQFRIVFDAIRQLMKPPARPTRRIGFQIRESAGPYRTLRDDSAA
jgi:hypothetical protein